jgi:hypothetical protein
VQDFTVSWLRAYHAGIDPRADLGTAEAAGLGLLDLRNHPIYDVQTVRRRHVVQARRGAVRLAIPTRDDPVGLRGLAHPYFLFHVSGFVVVRLTLASWDLDTESSPSPETFRSLHRRLWDYDLDIEVELGASARRANLRSILNWLWLDMFDRIRGLPADLNDLPSVSLEDDRGAVGLHELCERGDIAFPYPVLAGTHYEIGVADRAREPNNDWVCRVIGAPDESEDDVTDLAAGSREVAWYASEMQSVVVVTGQRPADGLVSLEPNRLQLAEFFALRRGAVRSIQRDTQMVLAEGQPLSRRRIDEWRRIVASTSDDYVLHDDTGPLVTTLTKHFRSNERVRDPEPLREQVTRNIGAFQERIDIAGQRAGIVLGVLFGVVAALSLSPIVKQLLASALGLSPATAERFASHYPWWSVAVDLGIVSVLGVVALALFKRVSTRLPSARRYGRSGSFR